MDVGATVPYDIKGPAVVKTERFEQDDVEPTVAYEFHSTSTIAKKQDSDDDEKMDYEPTIPYDYDPVTKSVKNGKLKPLPFEY